MTGPRGGLAEIQDAGYKAVALTVDTGVQSRRDLHLEALYTANGGQPQAPRPVGPGSDPKYLSMITWEYVRYLRTVIKVPFGLKGIMHPDDARASVDCGLDFIWISNHGGRQLDSGRATIDALPRVAAAVGNRVPIIIDGGFRRGTDIIKALALGATIVAVGRPYMWGLAHGGAEGAAAITACADGDAGGHGPRRPDVGSRSLPRRGGLHHLLGLSTDRCPDTAAGIGSPRGRSRWQTSFHGIGRPGTRRPSSRCSGPRGGRARCRAQPRRPTSCRARRWPNRRSRPRARTRGSCHGRGGGAGFGQPGGSSRDQA